MGMNFHSGLVDGADTVQTFSASFPTGAIFASPAGVTPTAYDGHATAQQNVWKSDRESELSHVELSVRNWCSFISSYSAFRYSKGIVIFCLTY